ncbi:MAG: beta-galactosidase [Defluviitaleaceae bacterium]|nr:beta-galactosidase [Defluviitaleaceae bacterium]
MTQNPTLPDFKAYFGKDVPILSGAIHYFRVHPNYWRDRLEKLRACGLNTVETYVPWNFHEPKEGQFNFEGFGDLPKFIETAADVGLKVIIRPGPYICAEWEFGGFPAWLNAIPNMRLRCMWPAYLEKVRNYFSVLLPKITPYLLSKGGPVIAMQIENEYGSFGSDHEYLRYTEDLMRELGVDGLLFTSDGPTIDMLTGGTVPGVWMTANFGSNPEGNFPLLRAFQPQGPDMCMEFWCGWFDRWGVNHHTRSAEDVADTMERMVKMGASFNFYMFHGGTNFGFWNGANIYDGKYHPTITSYDYCAPLTEAGDMTDTYHACKAALERYFGPAPSIAVSDTKKKAYGKVKLDKRISLWDSLGEPVKAASPLTFEELGQGYGYVLYRKEVTLPPLSREELEKYNYQMPLGITGLADRAVVFTNGKKVGVIYRNNPHEKLQLPLPASGDSFTLDILVENMGRVNYGHGIQYPCGISGVVTIGHYAVYDWEMYSLPLEKLPTHSITTTEESPAFYTGTFTADEACDTFLEFKNFRKGAAFINGFNLGRYWEVGPMGTLFIPAPLLKVGENEVVLFETDGLAAEPEIELKDAPYWVKVN